MIFIETSQQSLNREIQRLLAINDGLDQPSEFVAGAICSLLWIENGKVAASDFFTPKES